MMLRSTKLPNYNSVRFYRPELDVLRFGAFLMVYLTHTLPALPHESRWRTSLADAMGLGVPLFFTLSAYLITELLRREKLNAGHVNIRGFYVRRILRIWPLYFLILGISFLLARFQATGKFSWMALLAYLLFTGNWFTGRHGYLPDGAGPLWSISLEEQFYLLWPLAVSRFSRKVLGAICCVAWLLSQLTVVGLSMRGVLIEPTLWTNSLVHLQYFALGAGISLLLNGHLPSLSSAVRILAVGSAIVFPVMICFVLTPYPQSGFSSLRSTFPEFLLANLPMAGLLIAFLGWHTFENSKILCWLGKISYGLYIYHLSCLILLWSVIRAFPVKHISITVLPLGLIVTICAAAFSYRFIELPFLRYKERFEMIRSRPLE